MFDWVYMGNRIRIVREQRNMTQAALAARMEVSVSHLRSIEYGQVRMRVDHLAAAAEALDVSMDYLATGKLECSKGLDPIVLNLYDCRKTLAWMALRGSRKHLVRSPFRLQRSVLRKISLPCAAVSLPEEAAIWERQ